jgi:hypothetical protein
MRRLQEMHLLMSTFAVEISRVGCERRCGSEMALQQEEVEMRIVETGMAGLIALASQFLIVAAVFI